MLILLRSNKIHLKQEIKILMVKKRRQLQQILSSVYANCSIIGDYLILYLLISFSFYWNKIRTMITKMKYLYLSKIYESLYIK